MIRKICLDLAAVTVATAGSHVKAVQSLAMTSTRVPKSGDVENAVFELAQSQGL